MVFLLTSARRERREPEPQASAPAAWALPDLAQPDLAPARQLHQPLRARLESPERAPLAERPSREPPARQTVLSLPALAMLALSPAPRWEQAKQVLCQEFPGPPDQRAASSQEPSSPELPAPCPAAQFPAG
jgi:hypothetical protein